jgi:hypothetical protein
VSKGVKAVTKLLGGKHKKHASVEQGRLEEVGALTGEETRVEEREDGKGKVDGDISLIFGKGVGTSPKKGGKRSALKKMFGFGGKK